MASGEKQLTDCYRRLGEPYHRPHKLTHSKICSCSSVFIMYIVTILVLTLALIGVTTYMVIRLNKLECMVSHEQHDCLQCGYVVSSDLQQVHLHTSNSNVMNMDNSRTKRSTTNTDPQVQDVDKDVPKKKGKKNKNRRTTGEQVEHKLRRKQRKHPRKGQLRKYDRKYRELSKTVSRLDRQISDMHVHHFNGRFTAQLSDSTARIIRNNAGRSIKTGFGSVTDSTILPNDNKSYSFWNKDTEHSDRGVNIDENGRVTISKSGTYFIYAQILYNDSGPRVAFAVRRGTPSASQPSNLLKCLSAVRHGPRPPVAQNLSPEAYEMCATSGVFHLQAGDTLDVMPLYVSQRIVPDGSATFWGLTYLGGKP